MPAVVVVLTTAVVLAHRLVLQAAAVQPGCGGLAGVWHDPEKRNQQRPVDHVRPSGGDDDRVRHRRGLHRSDQAHHLRPRHRRHLRLRRSAGADDTLCRRVKG